MELVRWAMEFSWAAWDVSDLSFLGWIEERGREHDQY